jgi:diguanylate cyclase (GGDEF)-like protein
MQSEINDLNKEIRRLKKLAYKDHLTGLLNRRGFEESIMPAISQFSSGLEKLPERKGFIVKSISLILIDIDNFKDLNDKYGHPGGDEVLKHLATLLRVNFRKSDIIGRWGGEEMIIGMIGADASSATKAAEKLQALIRSDNFKPRYAFSAGVSSASEQVKEFKTLYEMADNALYEAKNTGKNKVVTSTI